MANWIWLPGARRHYDLTIHRFVSAEQVRTWSRAAADASADVTASLADMLTGGQINVNDWTLLMRDEIKDAYIQEYVLGRGGLEQMTKRDWGSIGGMLKEQYRYLDTFASEIAGGQVPPGRIVARAQLYSRSAREAYWRAYERALVMPSLPDYPGSGNTECLTNCRCEWDIREIRDRKGKTLHWECFWRLRPAEHCTSDETDKLGRPRGCVERADLWNPLVLTPVARKGSDESGYYEPHFGRPGEIGGSHPREGGTAGSLRDQLEELRPALAEAAQQEYDRWEQDEEGNDPELGTGGICDQVSMAMGSVIAEAMGGDAEVRDGGQEGDDHSWLIVFDREKGEIWGIDIPAGVYEEGGGYRWTKLPGVKIGPDDVQIVNIGWTIEEVEQFLEPGEGWQQEQGEEYGEEEKGSRWSGHYGHEGRPGEVGGSKPGHPKPEEEPKRDPFEPWPGDFASLAEMEVWAEKRYPWIKFGFKDMDLQTANETIKQMFLLEKAYPEAMQTVNYIGTYWDQDSPLKGEVLPASAWGSVRTSSQPAIGRPLKVGIFLNPDVYRDRAKFLRQLANCVIPDIGDVAMTAWHPQGSDTVAAVMTHEFGHVYDFWLLGEGNRSASPVVSDNDLGLLHIAWGTWIGNNEPRASEVSQYALHGRNEFVAEAFTALWHMPRADQPDFVRNLGPLMTYLDQATKYKIGQWKYVGELPQEERAAGRASLEPLFKVLKRLGAAREDQW